MEELRFEWDLEKARENQLKHDVTFEEAQSVFYDDHARYIHDPDHSEEEERFVLLGMSKRPRILAVCHCYREKESVVRIISARKATPHERENYEENFL